MRWVVMSRSRLWVLPVVIGIMVLGYVSLRGHVQDSGVEKDVLLNEALANTRESASYRFRINSRLESKEETVSYYSQVEGATVPPDRVHIKGTLINSPIELIQIEDTTYMKDQITSQWLILKGNRLAQSELFITELNPLGVFNFKNVPEISYEGRDGRIGRTNDVLEIKPMVANPFLEVQFTDFDYRLWVDAKDRRINKANITARSKSAADQRLVIDIEFWDYDREIAIEPPQAPPSE